MPPGLCGAAPRSAALPGPGGRRARDRLRSGPAQGDPAVPVAVPHPGGAAASRANRDRHGTVRRRPRARRSMRADRPWDCPALATCCSTAVPTWSGSGPATSPTPTSRPWPPSTPPRTARTAGWPVSRSLAPPRCWTPSGCLRCELPHPPWVAMMTSPLRRLPVQGCLDGAGNGKHDPKQRPETHDPVGRGEQRHEHGKHAEKDGLTAVPARRRYRLCQSQLHEDTSSETVSAHETVSAQWTAALLPPPVRGSARRDHWPAGTPALWGVRARRRTRKPCGKRSPGSSPGGPTPVAGEGPDHPHRCEPQPSRLAHPAPPQARHQHEGTYVYGYPAKKALVAVMAKVQTLCRQSTNLPLDVLLPRLNRMLLGWTTYFKYGCSHATFSYLRSYLWKQVIRWQERRHRRTVWKELRRRYGRDPPTGAWNCSTRQGYARNYYYYRGAQISIPWPSTA